MKDSMWGLLWEPDAEFGGFPSPFTDLHFFYHIYLYFKERGHKENQQHYKEL
jgi:hypothetical protein